MSTQLGGTGRLADDLWLVAHHEITGKPHLRPRAAGVGLAGGLLAELMLAGGIRLWRGMIVPAGGPVSRDGLARAVLVQVTSEGKSSVPLRAGNTPGPQSRARCATWAAPTWPSVKRIVEPPDLRAG